ncbi:MAG: endonuclease III domain-containing protein [Promethearchaeota archaeon]
MMKIGLSALFDKLLAQYGEQGWWPLLSLDPDINPTLRGQFTGYHPKVYSFPKTDAQIFEIMLGTILTQNTSWTNADKALGNLWQNRLLAFDKIEKLSFDKLGSLIRSSGYFNQKSVRILEFCEFLHIHPISQLKKMNIESLRKILINQRGIGPETADSMILYAFKKPTFVIDAYTRRFLTRLGFFKTSPTYEQCKELFEEAIPPELSKYNEYHALIVQHAVHICKTTPTCGDCFLKPFCKQNIVKKKRKSQKSNNTKSKIFKKSQ